ARRQIKDLQGRLASHEADALADAAEDVGGTKLVTAALAGWGAGGVEGVAARDAERPRPLALVGRGPPAAPRCGAPGAPRGPGARRRRRRRLDAPSAAGEARRQGRWTAGAGAGRGTHISARRRAKVRARPAQYMSTDAPLPLVVDDDPSVLLLVDVLAEKMG